MKKLQTLLLTLLFSWITSPVFSATNVYYPANQILRSPLFQCLVNTPSTPPSGMDKLYCKTADGKFYKLTSAGVETEIGSGGSDVANDAIFDASGDLVQGTGANTSAKLTKGAEGTLLRAGATLNAYTSSTFADTYAKGTFLYAATANTIASLAHPGAANYFLYTNATDTATWLSGANLTSLAGLTFADASIVQLTGVGTSAVLTSGGNNYFLKSSTDNSALMFATPAEVKTALGYITAASEIHVDDILTALGIASEATHFGTFTGSTIADNQTAKAAIQALETSLELKANAANSALTGSGTAETLTITKQIFAAPTELTIATDAITLTQTFHTVDTEADAATDWIKTITAGTDGQRACLLAANSGRIATIDETGNCTIDAGSTRALSTTQCTWMIYSAAASKWLIEGLPDIINFNFGSDAQYDIPMRGATAYGRLATSAGMQSFLGLGITVSGNDVTFPGAVTATAADGYRRISLLANTGAMSPTASAYEFYIESSVWKMNINGTEKSIAYLESPSFTTPSIGVATGISLALTGNLTGLMPPVIVTKPSGTSADVASETVLTHADDGSAENAYVGMTLYNITDGVSGTVTASTSTTITVAAGSMSWANTNVYQLGPGPSQSGSVFYVGTAGTIRHPATAGYVAAYYVDVAGAVIVDMASDSMIFQGVVSGAFATLDAGDCIESPATAGSYYVIQNKSATSAVGWGFANTWIDGGAS